MEELARECDSSAALIYHYFTDRRGLTIAALTQAADELAGSLAPEPQASAIVQLAGGLGAYLDYLETHPVSWSALLSASATGDPEFAAIARRVDDEAVRVAVRALGFAERPVPEMLEIALRGWLEVVKATCLRWLTEGAPARSRLESFLASAFVGCVQAAADADPECQPAIDALR